MAKKVLVVDDEKLIVKGIRFSLEQDGMEVDCAYDGEEALRMAREKEYDIILLDVMLPKLDGFEVCQQLRETSSVPVVMLTVRHDKRLAHAYGIANYLNKPLDAPGLLDVVESYCVGSKNHDILLLGDFWPESNILRTEMSRRKWVVFEVYDLEAAELYLSKKRPKSISLGMPEDKYEQARLRLKHPLNMPIRNM